MKGCEDYLHRKRVTHHCAESKVRSVGETSAEFQSTLQGLTRLRALSLMSSISPAGVQQLAPALRRTLTSLAYNGGGMSRARSGGSGLWFSHSL